MSNSPEVRNIELTNLTNDLPDFNAALAVRETKHGVQFMIIDSDKGEVVSHVTLSGPGTAELINQALEVLANG